MQHSGPWTTSTDGGPSRHPHSLEDGESVFHFARFTLDLQRGELLSDGSPVALRPCALRVLTYLVRHAGRVVSRDELFDHIWSGVVVADGSLTQSVWEVRRALQGAGDGEDLIRTRRGSGYCFTAAVRRDVARADTGPGHADEARLVPTSTPPCGRPRGPSRDDLVEIARLLRLRAQLTRGREALEGLVAAYDSLIALTQRLALSDLEVEARLARAQCMLLEPS